MFRRGAQLLLLLLCVGAGILLGALNPHSVVLDLYGMRIEAGLGLLVWCSAFVGALLAGLACLLGCARRRSRAEGGALTAAQDRRAEG